MRAGYMAAVITVTAAGTAVAQAPEPFDHVQHARVFPACSGCHAGIETGIDAERFPTPASCVNCHDGVTEDSVVWTGPTRRVTNLQFDHPRHTDTTSTEPTPPTCQACHQQLGETARMAVAQARPELCISCHAHEAPEHLASTADCIQCHRPLTRASTLSTERVAAFPTTASHDRDDFVLEHGRDLTDLTQRSCSVCHARESCERCHINARSVPSIQVLDRDARVAEVIKDLAPEYPTPASHERVSWRRGHEVAAEHPTATCANCHTQTSCETCHAASRSPAIARLPTASAAGPPGVRVTVAAGSVHQTGYTEAHASAAAVAADRCMSCHDREAACTACHTGPDQTRFHGQSFRERHAAQAWGVGSDCTSCHDAATFCRACHIGSGAGAVGRSEVAYHTARPLWLLGHGEAARQGLDRCASCHAQADCLQCHSAKGAWRISPHGPGFDGTRWQQRNRFACDQCHRELPGDGL